MNETTKKILAGIISACLIICVWWIIRGGGTGAPAAGDDVMGRVDAVEDSLDSTDRGLESAGSQIEAAAEELDRADTGLAGAAGAVEQLQGAAAENQRIVDECTDIVERCQERAGAVESLLADIETRNRSNGENGGKDEKAA